MPSGRDELQDEARRLVLGRRLDARRLAELAAALATTANCSEVEAFAVLAEAAKGQDDVQRRDLHVSFELAPSTRETRYVDDYVVIAASSGGDESHHVTVLVTTHRAQGGMANVRIELSVGGEAFEGVTDANGIADFRSLPVAPVAISIAAPVAAAAAVTANQDRRRSSLREIVEQAVSGVTAALDELAGAIIGPLSPSPATSSLAILVRRERGGVTARAFSLPDQLRRQLGQQAELLIIVEDEELRLTLYSVPPNFDGLVVAGVGHPTLGAQSIVLSREGDVLVGSISWPDAPPPDAIFMASGVRP